MAGDKPNARAFFMRNWYAVEAIPIYAIMGIAVGGAGWYMWRLANGPSVVWTKANPQPWNHVKQGENTKMHSVNQQFDRKWTREHL